MRRQQLQHICNEEVLQLSAAVDEETGMALQVLIAHTGERLQADPGSFEG
jgi:hypothetical protein